MEIPVLEYLDSVLTIVPTSTSADVIPLEDNPNIRWQLAVGGIRQVVCSQFPAISVKYGETLVKLWVKEKKKVLNIKCQVAI